VINAVAGVRVLLRSHLHHQRAHKYPGDEKHKAADVAHDVSFFLAF